VGILGFILTIYEVWEGQVKLLPRAEIANVSFVDNFLVNTGASKTMSNVLCMPPEVQKMVATAVKAESVQTATQIKYLVRGFATIELGGRVVKNDPVLLAYAPQSSTHFLGVNTLRRLLGDKILLDFRKG